MNLPLAAFDSLTFTIISKFYEVCTKSWKFHFFPLILIFYFFVNFVIKAGFSKTYFNIFVQDKNIPGIQ